jgi:predicted glycoside hydrolase/deacetylase ChbG (UPF0249 family)
MVTTPWSEQATRLCTRMPALSIGLHLALDSRTRGQGCPRPRRRDVRSRARTAVAPVLQARWPPAYAPRLASELHLQPGLIEPFDAVAQRCGVPLRARSPVRCLDFYGQWGDGTTHLDSVGVEALVLLLAAVHAGVTELVCRPAYVDGVLASSYRRERRVELNTLCDRAVRGSRGKAKSNPDAELTRW